MWNRSAIKCTLLLVAWCLSALPALAAPQALTGRTVWSKQAEISGPLLVPAGATLVIEAGTSVKAASADATLTVNGAIEVRGTASRPVRFEVVKGWKGVTLIESKEASLFAYMHVDGAETAISSIAGRFTVRGSEFRNCGTAIKLLRESPITIEKSLFENNDIGVDNEMRSEAILSDNRFIGHSKTAVLASHNSKGAIRGNRFERNAQGIGLLQPYPDVIAENSFSENKVGIYCNQTKNTPKIEANRFENNKSAVINFSFAYPSLEDNRFLGNEIAVHNDQYGSAQIRHNLFEDNDTAMFNNRKSNPTVEKNLFEKNRRVLFCDYSSYPRVRNNHFIDNPLVVELGIYQSADWEARSGSKPLMQKEAQARNSRNAMLAQAPTSFTDQVDVSNNWWGKGNAALQKAGAKANLELFYDRHDKERVVYEGFGPESYRLDVVVFLPCLQQPVADVGLRRR